MTAEKPKLTHTIATIALRPSLAMKIEIASRAQGISKAEFFRRSAIAEMQKLGIPLDTEDIEMKPGFRSDIMNPEGYISKREQARRERLAKICEKLKAASPHELPLDLQEFYKREAKK